MRYYFHLRIGQELNPDDLGMDLPDLDSAYLEAFQAAQDMWTELLAQRSDPLIRSFEIADERGRLLLTLPFVEVLDRARRRPMQLPQQVRSARLSLRGLGRSPILCGKRSARIIESAHETMRKSRTVLRRLSSLRPW